jgi:hypothetical protein
MPDELPTLDPQPLFMVHGDPYATRFLEAHPHYSGVYVRDDQGELRMGFPAPVAAVYVKWMGRRKSFPRGIVQSLLNRIRREVKATTPGN